MAKVQRVECGDGCGVLANVGRRFLPGHDAKLASMLRKVANGVITEAELPKLVRDAVTSGEEELPGATVESHTLTVTVRIETPKGHTTEQALEKLAGRMLRNWSVTPITVKQQKALATLEAVTLAKDEATAKIAASERKVREAAAKVS